MIGTCECCGTWSKLIYHIPNVMVAGRRGWICSDCLEESRRISDIAAKAVLEGHERAQAAIDRILAQPPKTYRYGRITPDLSVGKRHSLNRSLVLRWLGHRCQICGSVENLEIHHVKTVRIGGTNDLRNLAVLCEHCHRKRVHADGTRGPPRPLAISS